SANQDDGSCTYTVLGCTDPAANNYDPAANQNNGSCTYDVLGCTDPAANNYDPTANEDDDSCTYDPAPVLGCMDESANNFNSDATQDTDPTSCTYDPAPVLGCTNPEATNYNPAATQDDGSCITQAPADVTPPVSTFDEGRGHEIIDTELLSLSLTGQSSDDVGPVGDAKSGVASAEMTIYSIPDILVDGQLNGAAWEALSCAQIPENAVPIEIVALNLVSVNPLQVSWSHDLANPANGIYCAVVHATDNAGNVENTGVAGPFAYTFVAPTPTPTPPPSGGGGGSGSGGGGGGTGFYLSPTISGGGGGGGGQVLGAATTGEVLGESVCSVEYLHDYLRQGKKNDSGQVNLLQEFLNKELGLNLPITGFFGQLTRTAVEQFQVKHKEQVLRPWLSYGLPSENTPTGYVYKTTKRWINMLECPDLNLQMPTLP
ncbi:MAG: hypothetical protein Q7R94_02260, partial [bacterium]|nr:hypothetical protein [bacterium]